MKKDIEHVVTSTAMFLIAFIVSSSSEPTKVEATRRRRIEVPSLLWFTGTAMLVGALVWTTTVYLNHVAFCAHLRLSAPAMALRPGTPPPPSLEYVDLSALGIEAVLLTALMFFGIRAIRLRRIAR